MRSQTKAIAQPTENEFRHAQITSAWWRNPYCWLVIAGPITVILAGLITVWIAIESADPVIDANYYQKGLALSKGASLDSTALVPARQARNHAATGGAPSIASNK